MVSQILHIQNMEVMFCHQGYDFPEAGNDTARKYIFFNPGISCVFLLAADEMEKEYATRIQHLVHAVHEPAVIFPAHVLHHAHADHTVKFHAAFRQIPVIHELNVQKVFQSFLLYALFKTVILLRTQGDAGSFDSVFPGRPD